MIEKESKKASEFREDKKTNQTKSPPSAQLFFGELDKKEYTGSQLQQNETNLKEAIDWYDWYDEKKMEKETYFVLVNNSRKTI